MTTSKLTHGKAERLPLSARADRQLRHDVEARCARIDARDLRRQAIQDIHDFDQEWGFLGGKDQ